MVSCGIMLRAESLGSSRAKASKLIVLIIASARIHHSKVRCKPNHGGDSAVGNECQTLKNDHDIDDILHSLLVSWFDHCLFKALKNTCIDIAVLLPYI